MKSNSMYQHWLDSKSLSVTEKEEIKSWTPRDIDTWFTDSPFVFGTSGINRKIGLSPQQWNKYTYRLAAVGYARYIRAHTHNNSVLVACDNRPGGDVFAMHVADILQSNGLEVFLSHKNMSMPTPMVSYQIIKRGFAGAIVITAGDKSMEYNGFKCFNELGHQVDANEESIILQYIPPYEDIFNFCSGNSFDKFNYLNADYQDDYFRDLTKSVEEILNPHDITHKDIKVLFTSHHGTSSRIMRKYAHDSGFQSFEEYAPECTLDLEWDQSEILNPEIKESYVNSVEHAKKNQFSYLMAHDPDSNKNALLEKQPDDTWYLFNPSQIAVLMIDFLLSLIPGESCQFERDKFLDYLQTNNKDIQIINYESKKSTKKELYIVSSYMCGNYLKKLCENRAHVYFAKTGFKNIAKKITEHENDKKLLFAFEESMGSLIFPICKEKDGFQESIMLLNMICKHKEKGVSLLQKYQQICQKHGFWIGITKSFESNDDNWNETFDERMQKILNYPAEPLFGHTIKNVSYSEEEGAAIMLLNDDNWIKFRISGSEPKFKISYNFYGCSELEIQEKIRVIHRHFRRYLKFW